MARVFDAELLLGAGAERLYRVRHTVLEMLQDRGYLIAKKELEMTLPEFLESHGAEFHRSSLDLVRFKRDNPSDSIRVFFVEKSLGKGNFEPYLQQVKREDATRGIFVVKQKPTGLLERVMGLISGLHLEVFMEMELLVNISRHHLAPKHELLTRDQKQLLLKKYNVKQEQLPRMQACDPQAKYLGAKTGDVVKIIRTSETAGKYVTYRLVLPAN